MNGTISHEDFHFIQGFIKNKSAMVLDDNKGYLVEARLSAIMKDFKADNIGSLINQVRINPFGDIAKALSMQ